MEVVLRLCIHITIVALALLLNIIGMYLICKQGDKRTNQNLIIVHLSTVQILILVGIIFLWVLNSAIEWKTLRVLINWIINLLLCSRVTVMLIIAILTFDRLIAIKYSLRYKIILSKRRVKAALIFSWLPWMLSSVVVVFDRSFKSDEILSYFIVPIVDCLLLLFLICVYSYIYWRICKRQRMLRNISRRNLQRESACNQALLVSISIVLSYVLFALIPDLYKFLLHSGIVPNKIIIIHNFHSQLHFSFYITLPVIYIFGHKDRRGMFMRSFVKCCNCINRSANDAPAIPLMERGAHGVAQ